MTSDSEGFAYPEIDARKCVNCGLCQKTCPALSLVAKNAQPDCAYAAWATDDRLRCASSSGGLFSIFAEHVLKQGGVVNGVAFDAGLNLRHRLVMTVDDLAAVRGSKYVQADVGLVYRDVERILKKGRPFLFVSTPCQVAGLKAYLGKDYENLITCDIICHGVPSPSFFKSAVVNQYGVKQADVKDFQFRDLLRWGFAPCVFTNDGCHRKRSYKEDYYYTTFLAGLSYRECCYSCRYACFSRVGDLTLGDFWGLPLWFRLRYDTSKGCSLVLANTDKACAFLDAVRGELYFARRSCSECRENHQLYRPTLRPEWRTEFYKKLLEMSPDLLPDYFRRLLRRTTMRQILDFPDRAMRKSEAVLVAVVWKLRRKCGRK